MKGLFPLVCQERHNPSGDPARQRADLPSRRPERTGFPLPLIAMPLCVCA